MDSAGSAYVSGFTSSPGFPTTTGAYDTSSNGDDAFITKLNASGTAPVYSTFLGGASGTEEGLAIAVDGTGAAYVTGLTQSTNFPTTAGALRTTATASGGSAFVTKLTPDGSTLAYSTYLGGDAAGGSDGTGIAVDAGGAAYVSGFTGESDFPTTAGAFDTTKNGSTDLFAYDTSSNGDDAFITKLNPSGSAPVYSTFLGGSSADSSDQTGRNLAVDSSGSAYVTGYTSSTDFPVTAGAFQTTPGDTQDGFVTKLSPSGASLAYSTYLGGTSAEIASAVAVDGSGAAYVTGETSSSDFPSTAGAYDGVRGGPGPPQGPFDAFVTKLNAAGSGAVYSTFLGGRSNDKGSDIGVDSGGAAYVAGDTGSDDFPDVGGVKTADSQDAFVAKLNPAGSALAYATPLGGSGSDAAYGIAVSGSGGAFVTGYTDGSGGFQTTPGAFATAPLRALGGFPEKLGRIGDRLSIMRISATATGAT